MTKQPSNHRTEWTADQKRQLKQLASQNTPTPIVAIRLKRTEAAVQSMASQLGVSLKPTNKSPYG